MTQYILKRADELTAENSKFRMQGFSGPAQPGATEIDWQLPEERWITGGTFLVKGGHWGDTADLSLMMPIPGGMVVEIQKMAAGVRIATDVQVQCSLVLDYIRAIPAGCILRITYHNVGLTDVEVALNLITHIPADVLEA